MKKGEIKTVLLLLLFSIIIIIMREEETKNTSTNFPLIYIHILSINLLIIKIIGLNYGDH